MKLDRTKNSIRNMIWGIANQIVSVIMPFVVRTIFIYSIGADYLGLSSLFASILTVLNLAELGFSSAITFNMYKPIAENDTDKICALMNYYKTVYRVIGSLIAVVGLALIPFLDRLIKGDIPADINLTMLYLLYLGNSVISYFLFAYKNCILTAYQREDIISKITIVLKFVMCILQAAVLLLLKSYYGYVVCMIFNTILTNIITAFYSNKIYPQYQCSGELSADEHRVIRKNIGGLMIGKICMVSRNAFDNIFLSLFSGLKIVTIYGNYYYIMNSISGMLSTIVISIGAGIGNSVATETVEKNYKDFKKITFMYAWISSWCAVCLFCLFQPFMAVWMGKDLMFPMIDVVLICLYFYFLTMGDVRSRYSTAVGLFWENRVYVLVEAIVNIILNYCLGRIWGVHGIIIATAVSIFFINFGWGASIIFKHYFKGYKLSEYYLTHMTYLFNAIIAAGITYIVTKFVPGETIFSLIIRFGICLIVPNLYFVLVYKRKVEFSESLIFIKRNILRR